MKSNKRNKAKKSKVANTIDFELLQDELRKNNRHHKPSKSNKRRADRR